MRFAIYATPKADSIFARKSAEWLGYDIDSGAQVAKDDKSVTVVPAWIAEPSRYGFHATMKAPFRLRDSVTQADLMTAFESFCRRESALEPLRLEIRAIAGFLAFVPINVPPALQALAARCVETFDGFRAPMSAAEREKRLRSPLTREEVDLMDRWGYPYVFDRFRFHMTLTGFLPAAERDLARTNLEEHFGLDPWSLTIDQLALCMQPSAEEPFRLLCRAKLVG